MITPTYASGNREASRNDMLDSWFNAEQREIDEVNRDSEVQAKVDIETAELALYHYETCMFCARVRRAIAHLKLNIELRDIMRDNEHYRALAYGGGRTTVPCLLINKSSQEPTWMFESNDIIEYLVDRFGSAPAE